MRTSPRFENLVSKFYKELINSKFRDDLEKEWGNKYLPLQSYNYRSFLKRL